MKRFGKKLMNGQGHHDCRVFSGLFRIFHFMSLYVYLTQKIIYRRISNYVAHSTQRLKFYSLKIYYLELLPASYTFHTLYIQYTPPTPPPPSSSSATQSTKYLTYYIFDTHCLYV